MDDKDGRKTPHTELTLAEVAELLGISKQSVSAGEKRAMAKLRRAASQDVELMAIVRDLFGGHWEAEE